MIHLLIMSSFAEKIIKASKGEKGIVEPSYVYLPGVQGGDAIAKTTGTDYFSVPIELGVSEEYSLKSFSIFTDMHNSPAVPRRPSTSSAVPTTKRRLSSRPATAIYQATSQRVSTLSQTLLRNKCSSLRSYVTRAYEVSTGRLQAAMMGGI